MRKNILFPFAVIISTVVLIRIYNKSIISNINDGFVAATTTLSNKYICGATEFKCVNNIIKDLNKNNHHLLIIGNSQLGTINQKNKNETSYGNQLSLVLEKNNKDLIARSIWLANINFREIEIIISSIKKCTPNLKHIIIPAFLDDTREKNVRDSIKTFEKNICSVEEKKIYPIYEKNDKEKTNSTLINNLILTKVPILNNLQNLNDKFRNSLYQLRNTVFGIKPSTKRRIIPSAYKSNINALKNLKEISEGKLILYIPPLLYAAYSDKIPYENESYKAFKETIIKICNSYQRCIYKDLDQSVPDNLWGEKNSTSLFKDKELDFMHFNYKGHVVFTYVIYEVLKNHNLIN